MKEIQVLDNSRWIWVGIDSALFVIILIGNLLTAYVLKTNLRHSKVLSNRFVLSLALSDMLVGLSLPYHLAFTIFPQLSENEITCILRFVLVLFACCASILNVTCIAADRYLAIVHPFKYEIFMTKRSVRRMVCLAFSSAIVLSTVPLYWNNWSKDDKICELGNVLPRYYITAVLMPAFLLVWSTMIAIYSKIWKEAVCQAEKLRRTNIVTNQQCRPSFQVVLFVMGCFTICWLPFLIVACAQAAGYSSIVGSNGYKTVLTLALSSSALNPLIYAWKNQEFKETFRNVLGCKQNIHNNKNAVIETNV